MSFNSLQFLIFLPVVLSVNYILPKRIRYIWLLAASYYFYMCWNVKYVFLILAVTVVSYISALVVDFRTISVAKTENNTGGGYFDKRRICFVICIVVNIALLLFFKYFHFVLDNISLFLGYFQIQFRIPEFDILLPMGISFYIFQALGYVIDVYRGEIYAEKNFFRYALFVSFFPQLVAGPIERSKNLLKQLAVPQKASFDNFREGILLMFWGFFLKVVLSDRIAIFVNTVYGTYDKYPGVYLIVATILFAFQIYCDFYGYSVIAMGSAKMLGIQLQENFNVPYFAQSVAEFWRRWHISFSSWLRDYIYIPLGGNRKGTLRKYLNILLTFGISGFWHGANWGYIVWGGLNGIYQICGNGLKPIWKRGAQILTINRDNLCNKFARISVTFVLVDFSWIFFRAPYLQDSANIIRSIFTDWNPWILFDGSLYACGLDCKDFSFMLICLGVLFIADCAKYRGIKIREILIKQDMWFQILLIPICVIFLLVFGVWGSNYNAADFIYFQF